MVTASDGNHRITRNSYMFKPVKLKKQIVTIESDEQDEDIDIEGPPNKPPSSDGVEKTTKEERRYPLRATRGQMPRAFKDFELNP